MWEILPDSGTVHAIVKWLAFIVLLIFILGAGAFALALVALGADKFKRQGKKLLGRADVLALGNGIASVNTVPLHHWVDDPDDALIILFAQALRQDPAGMVKQVNRLFTIFGQLQLVWPQIREALGVDSPPRGVSIAVPTEAIPKGEA